MHKLCNYQILTRWGLYILFQTGKDDCQQASGSNLLILSMLPTFSCKFCFLANPVYSCIFLLSKNLEYSCRKIDKTKKSSSWFFSLIQVDVGNFLRFKSCVLYTELEDPEQPMINVEVVAHVMRPEHRSSEVRIILLFWFVVFISFKHILKWYNVNYCKY